MLFLSCQNPFLLKALGNRKVTQETKGETQGRDYAGRQHPEGPIKYHLEATNPA